MTEQSHIGKAGEPLEGLAPVAQAEPVYDMRRLSYAGTFKNPFKAGSIRVIEWPTAKVQFLRLIRSFEKSGAPHGAPFWPKAIRQTPAAPPAPAPEAASAPPG